MPENTIAGVKPQAPLKYKGDHIFPVTTYDQIIMRDGSRWNGYAESPASLIGKLKSTHDEDGNVTLYVGEVE